MALHAESFVVVHFMSSTLNGTPTEMTASMGSSDHKFFSPRVQLNIRVAQTSTWLLDVCSPRSDEQCRVGDRQDAFQSNAAHRDECASTRSQHGFHPAVGDLVLTCFGRVDGSRNRID